MTTTLPPLSSIDMDHGKVAWREAGDGAPLVLLHGLGSSSKSWECQYRDLSDRFRVVGWDCPGYGGSDDLPDAAPQVDGYVAAAVGLLDALGLDTVALVGHSMGGVIAGRLAAERPERIDRLVLSCTSAGWGGPRHAGRAAGYRERLEQLRTMSAAEFGEARAASMVAEDADASVRAKVAAIASEVRLSGYGAACHLLESTDNASLLKHLDVPTLVISAELDRVAPAALADELEALIRGSRRAVVPGAGHAPYAENPDAYNAALRGFLGG